eukprot:TRINITY_DN5335_c0_g1_i1.p1 TRINITY_DN5335_c0_g1~~TRINITY_DN5335_c0_g1_i1.p1  ORF type:complete len:344 (-),score=58.40 TRINITY_DN5335_c0_g1_i1:39-1070(-)
MYSKQKKSQYENEIWYPFRYYSSSPDFDKPSLQMIFMGIFVAPIKLLLLLFIFLGLYVFALICSMGIGIEAMTSSPSRRREIFITAYHYCALSIGFVLGLKAQISGTRDKSVPCMVANHMSYIDIIVFSLIEPVSAVAKESVSNYPIVGVLSRAIQCVFVPHAGDSAQRLSGAKTIDHSETPIARIGQRQIPNDKTTLLIFPEGTTTNGRTIIRFRRGAFTSGHPVQPVVWRFCNDEFNPVWVDMPIKKHLFHLLTQPVVPIEITILPPYYPNDDEKKDAQLYADHVQQLMASELGVPATQHTIHDMVKLSKITRTKNISWRASEEEFSRACCVDQVGGGAVM